MKILLAEDDKNLAQSIQIYLEIHGHEVKWVTNGRQAFNLLEEEMYDAVISDVQMPGGNGVELLQSVWRSFATPPPFYVHSSEDTFCWANQRWDLPDVVGNVFKEFAIFRSKTIPDMLQEIQKWLDSIETS